MKKIILIITMFIFLTNVNAYENEKFKLDIPDTYKLNNETPNIYVWQDKKSENNITITLQENTEENIINIEEYTEEDLINYKDYLTTSLNKELEEYEVTVEVTNVKKEQINNYTAIEYDSMWPTKESIGYNFYQKGYIFTTKNYVVSLTFGSSKEITDETEFYKNAINSLTINDNKIEKEKKNTYIYIVIAVGVISGIVGYIISAIKKK